MRVSELLDLNIADLDFAQSLVTIQHGKGDRARVLPLGSGVAGWLREYIENVRPWLVVDEDNPPQPQRARV